MAYIKLSRKPDTNETDRRVEIKTLVKLYDARTEAHTPDGLGSLEKTAHRVRNSSYLSPAVTWPVLAGYN